MASICKVGLHWDSPRSPMVYSQPKLASFCHNNSKSAARNFNQTFNVTNSSVRVASFATHSGTTTTSSSSSTKTLRVMDDNLNTRLMGRSAMIMNKLKGPPKLPELPAPKWKPRQPTRIYDYNYKVGQSYYTPQTDYIGSKQLHRTDQFKPPESQTFAERYASNPIYGRAHGLPYEEKESVSYKPLAARSSGTQRASSVSRDSDTSEYLASLGPKETFKAADCRAFRRRSVAGDCHEAVESSRRRDSSAIEEFRREKQRIENDFKKICSLPPAPPRRDEKKIVFKQESGSRGQPIMKREETTYASPRLSRKYVTETMHTEKPPISFRTRNTSVGQSDMPEMPVSFRTRRSSFGNPESLQIPSSKYENKFEKYSSQTKIYASNSGDDTPRFRSAQNFRQAKKQIETEEISDQIKKTFETMKGSHPFDSRSSIRQSARNHSFCYGV